MLTTLTILIHLLVANFGAQQSPNLSLGLTDAGFRQDANTTAADWLTWPPKGNSDDSHYSPSCLKLALGLNTWLNLSYVSSHLDAHCISPVNLAQAALV